MAKKKRSTKAISSDPDDAPELKAEFFKSADLFEGVKLKARGHGSKTQCSLMTPPEAAVKKRQSKSRTSTVDMFETPATCTRPSSSSGVTGAQGEEEGQGRSQKAGVEQGVRGGRGKGMKRAREPREGDGRGGSNKERRGERGGGNHHAP